MNISIPKPLVKKLAQSKARSLPCFQTVGKVGM